MDGSGWAYPAAAICYYTMRFEFVSPIYVANKKSRGQSTILLVGILCFFIALIVEVCIGNKSAFVFVIPMFYLIYLRRQIGGNKRLKDTRIVIEISDSAVEMTFFNVDITREGVTSRQYTFPKNKIIMCKGDPERLLIQLSFDAQVSQINESGVRTSTKPIHVEKLVLHVPEESMGLILSALMPCSKN